MYGKEFQTTDFHYHNQFNQTIHTDFNNDTSTENKPAIRDNPVDYDNKSVSDYPESMITLMPNTQYTHGDAGGSYGTDISDDARLEGIRNAQMTQIAAGTAIKMIVKGQSYLQPGHIIDFNIRPVEEGKTSNEKKSYDPQYSGRYLITKIRHRVTKNDYKMVLEARKDSVREALPGPTIDNYHGIARDEHTQFQSLTDSNYANIAKGKGPLKYGL